MELVQCPLQHQACGPVNQMWPNLKRKKGGLLIKMELMTADYSLRRTGPENGIPGSSWIVESGEKCGLGQ